jgi:hypothetical protein
VAFVINFVKTGRFVQKLKRDRQTDNADIRQVSSGSIATVYGLDKGSIPGRGRYIS